jgi:hypothetical protein
MKVLHSISALLLAGAALIALPGCTSSVADSGVKKSGFAVTDLTKFNSIGSGASNVQLGGQECIARAELSRLTIMCLDAPASPAIDVKLSKSKDGTEARLRSGETTIAKMEELCAQRGGVCKMEALKLGGAVGFVSKTNVGNTKIHNITLFKKDDLMVIRAISEDADVAAKYGKLVLDFYGTKIVGQ